jgi:asparagine synthase (glutamine-hydrolysing)
MPGEMITVQNSKLKIQNFTELKKDLTEIKVKKKLEKPDVEKFRKILIEAIRKRLISEVPVGTCLSGGLDSSTVVSVVNQLLKEKAKETRSVGKIQQTFSAVFPDGSNNEEKYVEEVIHSQNIDKKRIKSYKIYPRPEEFFKEIEDFIKTQE